MDAQEQGSGARGKIRGLHGVYVAVTGLAVGLDMGREREWFEFIRKGFTEEDLRAVVGHLKRGIREGQRNPGALRFRNLIGQLDFFEEDLAAARAAGRSVKVSGSKLEVLRATNRPGDFGGVSRGKECKSKSTESKDARAVLESEGFKAFMKLKEGL